MKLKRYDHAVMFCQSVFFSPQRSDNAALFVPISMETVYTFTIMCLNWKEQRISCIR